MFCNITWRNFISDICKKIDKDNIGLQIISPFGFEVFEDKNFLNKSIKRLYCYIGLPNEIICPDYSPATVSKKFAEQLIASINEVGITQSDIAILVIQDKFILRRENNYKCKHSDKLIDIQTRFIDDEILNDYANYIICAVDSICSKKEEPKHFLINKRHRCRTYQLYVMLEKIFAYLLPPMTISQKEIFPGLLQLIDNSIQMFYTPSELYIAASHDEIYILHSLINPRVELMFKAVQALTSEDDIITILCDAYHVEGNLSVIINREIYENAVNKIRTTYLNYV